MKFIRIDGIEGKQDERVAGVIMEVLTSSGYHVDLTKDGKRLNLTSGLTVEEADNHVEVILDTVERKLDKVASVNTIPYPEPRSISVEKKLDKVDVVNKIIRPMSTDDWDKFRSQEDSLIPVNKSSNDLYVDAICRQMHEMYTDKLFRVTRVIDDTSDVRNIMNKYAFSLCEQFIGQVTNKCNYIEHLTFERIEDSVDVKFSAVGKETI